MSDDELIEEYHKSYKSKLVDRARTRANNLKQLKSTALVPYEEEIDESSITPVPLSDFVEVEDISRPLKLAPYIRELCERYPLHYSLAMNSGRPLFFVSPAQWELMEDGAKVGMPVNTLLKSVGIAKDVWNALVKEFPVFEKRLDYLRYGVAKKAYNLVDKKIDEENLEAVRLHMQSTKIEKEDEKETKGNTTNDKFNITITVKNNDESRDNIIDIE